MPNQIPDYHTGIVYTDFLSTLSRKRDVKKYLEVGVQEGVLFSGIHAEHAIGVDPEFLINRNIILNKKRVSLYSTPSDSFFNSDEAYEVLDPGPDLVFLDGYHTFEFLLRDFFNAESFCTSRSLIGMHDCLPMDDVMTIRNLQDFASATMGTKHQGAWTGDVWKVIPILRQYRPDLKIVNVNCAPTGVVFLTNLDPSSTVLQDNYMDIVKQFSQSANDAHAIQDMYNSIEITDAADILREFDNTLYFKT